MNMSSTTLVFIIIYFLFILPPSLASFSINDNIRKACTAVSHADRCISYNFCFNSLINSVDPNASSADLPALAVAATRIAIKRTADIMKKLTQYQGCVLACNDAIGKLESASYLIIRKNYEMATLKLRAARGAHDKCEKLIKGTSTGSKQVLLLANKEYETLARIAEVTLTIAH